MQGSANIVEYSTYCVLYMTAVLCNKYVLTSLGFQYPTIFQGWQALVAFLLIWIYSGNQLQQLTISELVPWIPAMLLYIGSIFSGSIALAHTSIPVFLLSHGASDVILIICDDHLPTGAVHVGIPLKLSALMLGLWSVHYDTPAINLIWILVHAVFSGAYRAVAYWYTSPQWPYSGLTAMQRQTLNNLAGFLTLLSFAFILGHHTTASQEFPHFSNINFYIGCICSGVLGWAVSQMWNKVKPGTLTSTSQMTQMAAKVLTLIISMQLFPVQHTLLLWSAILCGVAGDILHILGNMFQESDDLRHEVRDILIGT
uniref:Transmembrane protein 241 n=1 Tax=Phallusia mammillata TaxID=59560 RepID=A0A6F9DVP8_9ASCI|nr:transmembrane protein 241 [Phallusia mammillata]